MAELFITSDIVTCVLAFIDKAASALREECALSLLQYRMLAFLDDHHDGTAPIPLARLLQVSPASISVAARKLADKHLIVQGNSQQAPHHLFLSEKGLGMARIADAALVNAHEEYFSILPAHLRTIVDVGAVIANQGSSGAMHIRDGHFFTAFETLLAFLTLERLLTRSTHERGLSLTQFRIMFEADLKGYALPNLLAETLLLAPSSVTYALNGLRSSGFVEIEPAIYDKRMRAIMPTEAGRVAFLRTLAWCESVLASDVRLATRPEREAYKDAAALIVSSLSKKR